MAASEIKVEDATNESKKMNLQKPLGEKIVSSSEQDTDLNVTNNIVKSTTVASTIIHESSVFYDKKIVTKSPIIGEKVNEMPTTDRGAAEATMI